MSEKPIIFSAEMVRAIRDGRKTQTRRTTGLSRVNECPALSKIAYQDDEGNWIFWSNDYPGLANFTKKAYPSGGIRCPYIVGDYLWVRETWALVEKEHGCPHDGQPGDHCPCDGCVVEYRADTGNRYPGYWPDELADDPSCGRWHPSIHMPRWASRITLLITDVRVQRVQDISEEDAKAEGVLPISWLGNTRLDNYRTPFAHLWDSLNVKRGGWDTNLWVWAISFRRQM